MKHENTLMRKIENDADSLSPLNSHQQEKQNQIDVFESYNKVFTAMKMMDNTTKIITKKEIIFEPWFVS